MRGVVFPFLMIFVLIMVGVSMFLIISAISKKSFKDYEKGHIREGESKFKYLFCTLVSVIIIPLLIIVGRFIYIFTQEQVNFSDFILEAVLFFAVILIIIGVVSLIANFVYRDAKRRGMDPWLWTTVAVFIPNLIGLIIYLVARNSKVQETKQCLGCGTRVNKSFKLCPYCGESFNNCCSNCGNIVEDSWKLCPHCGNNLK